MPSGDDTAEPKQAPNHRRVQLSDTEQGESWDEIPSEVENAPPAAPSNAAVANKTPAPALVPPKPDKEADSDGSSALAMDTDEGAQQAAETTAKTTRATAPGIEGSEEIVLARVSGNFSNFLTLFH